MYYRNPLSSMYMLLVPDTVIQELVYQEYTVVYQKYTVVQAF
uniref:Uncharacterized protein n=1 Tax=Amphimedon queenslandica TaxID=400682 RepID=A0A1X7UR71_AMPQE